MTKVHPNAASFSSSSSGKLKKKTSEVAAEGETTAATTVLTVWKKSLLLNCNGFTVIDGKGNLLFRVDNYVSGNRGEVVLMDATGKPLFTFRRKRLSIGDNWLVYDGETTVNPRFTAKKQVNLLNSKCLAQVISTSPTNKNKLMYEIEGSYAQRSCAVYDDRRRLVAEIKRKDAVGGASFGNDVFRLVVHPEIDTSVAMALVILLDQMFASFKSRFSP